MLKSKNIFLLLCFVIVAALVAGCGGGSSDSEDKSSGAGDSDVIKIGFLGDLTGDTAVYGQNTLDGMKMAVEELNAAGGVLGKELS